MNEQWDKKSANAKLKFIPNKLICDALSEQDIFAAVGTIIKNEISCCVKIHPKSSEEKIPTAKLTKLIHESPVYDLQFPD